MVLSFALYVVGQRLKLGDDESVNVVAPQVSITQQNSPLPTQTSTDTFGVFQPTPSPKSQVGKYKDGEYTGIVADAFYGP